MTISLQLLATWLRARLGQDERGAAIVEYVFLVALIAVICIAAIAMLGTNASTKFSKFGESVSN